MAQFTRELANVAIALGSGTHTVDTLLDALDYSQYKVIECILAITAAATVVGTTLDVKIQMTPDGVTWDTRGRFSLVAGNQAATASTPYMQGLNISQDVDLTTAERNYIATGSNTGTELNPGTVRDGNFPRFLRLPTGRASSARIETVVTDVAGTGAFTGSLRILGHLWQ